MEIERKKMAGKMYDIQCNFKANGTCLTSKNSQCSISIICYTSVESFHTLCSRLIQIELT